MPCPKNLGRKAVNFYSVCAERLCFLIFNLFFYPSFETFHLKILPHGVWSWVSVVQYWRINRCSISFYDLNLLWFKVFQMWCNTICQSDQSTEKVHIINENEVEDLILVARLNQARFCSLQPMLFCRHCWKVEPNLHLSDLDSTVTVKLVSIPTQVAVTSALNNTQFINTSRTNWYMGSFYLY